MVITSTTLTIRVRGSEDAIEAFLTDVTSQYSRPTRSDRPIRRRGVVEVLETIAIAVAANTTYDAVKAGVLALAVKHRLTADAVESDQRPPGEDEINR